MADRVSLVCHMIFSEEEKSMVNQVQKLIATGIYAFIFCIGLYVIYSEVSAYTDTANTVRVSVRDKEIYQQYNGNKLEVVSKVELIATLFQSLDYDIQVEGVTIPKNSHTADQITSYGIQDANYLKSYKYTEDGRMEMIIYTAIESGGT